MTGWTDTDGRAVIYRGMNVSGDSKTNAGYLPNLDDTAYDLLPAYGITLARYLVFWEAIEPTEGVYDDAYLDTVATDIQRLRDRGVDVMVDFHQDVWGEGFGFTGFPAWTCDQAEYDAFVPSTVSWGLNYLTPQVEYCFDHFWASQPLQDAYAAMAAHTADRLGDLVVGYDTMNEPSWGTSGQQALETGAYGDFQANVAGSLRAADPNAWIALEPLSYTNMNGQTYLPFPADTPVGGGGLLYAPHFYPSYAESGAGWNGDFTDEGAWLNGLADDADTRKVGLWLGEFGLFSDNGNEADYVHDVIDAVEARNGSTSYWSFDPGQVITGDGPGVLLPAWQRPYVHAVPGNILSIVPSDSGSVVTYAPTDPTLPVDIVVPAGACASLSIAAEPAMTGIGTMTPSPTVGTRVQLYGDPSNTSAGIETLTLTCTPS